jgi:PadR family transcriptional regulator PadR
VASEDGPHRKYYAINETGKNMLADQRKSWKSFSNTMTDLLGQENSKSSRKNGGN